MSAPCLVRVKISARSTGSCFRSCARKRGLGRVIDLDDALRDALDGRGGRRHRDPRRIAQHRFGELGDVPGHRGGEEQRLPLDRQLGNDLPDVVDEAHVEHAVGLVEHEKFDVTELQSVALHEIEQPAGRGDQNLDARHDRADLTSHRDAADRQRRGQANVAAIGVEAVENLARQFTRRRKHQHAAGLGLRLDPMLQKPMQDRKREGCGLAGAGLGNADDVTAGEREGDGLSLDGRGREVAFFLERTRDGIGEAEILKGGQKVGSFHCKGQAPGRSSARAREGCRRHPRVWGVGFCWLKGASQKPLDGLKNTRLALTRRFPGS